jgi:hypothetical protein
MSESIIKVQFADRSNDGEFGKQEYTYYLAGGLSVEPGQVITVPTKYGHTRAKVSRINLSDGVIDMRYADSMRTITAADLAAETRAEPIRPARTPAGHCVTSPSAQIGFSDLWEGDV